MELLTALHLSTFMPDLTYDLVTSNDTEIVMLLHSFDDASFYYESSSGMKSEGEISGIAEGLVEDEEISAAYAQTILGAIGEAKAQTSEKYEPYVSRIENHWFRDIYFVANSDTNVINYNAEKEKEIRERRTLYETDDKGNYILFVLDENGNYKKNNSGDYITYSGTIIDAENDNIKVSKKPKTISLNSSSIDGLNDLGWSEELASGIWSAYDMADSNGTSMKNAFSDDGDELHSKIYVSTYTGNKLAQDGDALRGETNNATKNIFTQNKYFRYDGSSSTANIITELRQKQKINYGAIIKDGNFQNDNVKNKYEEKIELGNGKEYSIKDYVSNVSLNQDLLNAFNILENTHTIDSDYVYRDLKELALELGYYGKDDAISEETPKLLEWVIPQISGEGFPIRGLDKAENEFGTLLHAKTEYKAYSALNTDSNSKLSDEAKNLKNSKDKTKENMEEDESNTKRGDYLNNQEIESESLLNIDNIQSLSLNQFFRIPGEKRKLMAASGNSLVELYKNIVTEDFEGAGWDDILPTVLDLCTEFNYNSAPNYYTKGDTESYEKWVSSLGGVFSELAGPSKRGEGTGDDFVNACKYVYGLMDIAGTSYCNGYGVGYTQMDHPLMAAYGCDETSNPVSAYYGTGGHQAVLGHSSNGRFDSCMIDYDFLTCCNITVDKVYSKAGLFDGEGLPSGSSDGKYLVDNFGAEIVWDPADLQLGDLIECYDSEPYSDPSTWSGWHHVFFVGEVTDDEIVFYTTGSDYTAGGSFRKAVKKDGIQRSDVCSYNGWVGLHLFDLEVSKKYEGYNGNEAVVSPATGVLLEYGVYSKGKKAEVDSISNEEYRLNVDLQYDKNKTSVKDLGFGSQSIYDKVGYAKILVLDDENYLKLEKTLNTKWKDKDNSLFNEKAKAGNKYKDDLNSTTEMENWNLTDKTVYGYKEFVENYDKYGISGYVIFIDGFAPELPGLLTKDGTVKTEQELSMDYFIEKALNKDSDENYVKEINTKYRSDSSYGSISENITNKISAEGTVKSDANPAVYLKLGEDEVLLIKEGTIIGRTYTNTELYNMRKNSKEDAASEFADKIDFTENKVPIVKENSEDVTPLIHGNYVRLIMRKPDGEVVENIEDYMKLNKRRTGGIGAKVGTGLENLTKTESGEGQLDGFGYRKVVIDGEEYIDYQQAEGNNSSALLSDGRTFAAGACGPTALATALKKLGLDGGPLEVHNAGSYTTATSHGDAIKKLIEEGKLPDDVKYKVHETSSLPTDKDKFYEEVKDALVNKHIVVMDMREGSKNGGNYGNVYGTGDYDENEGSYHAHWVPLISYSTDSDMAYVANTCGTSQFFSLRTMLDLTYDAYMGNPLGKSGRQCDELGMVGGWIEVWR